MSASHIRRWNFDSLEDRSLTDASAAIATDIRGLREAQDAVAADAAAMAGEQTLVDAAAGVCRQDYAIVLRDQRTLNADTALRDAVFQEWETLHPWQWTYWRTEAQCQALNARIATDLDWLVNDKTNLMTMQNAYASDVKTLKNIERTKTNDDAMIDADTGNLARDIVSASAASKTIVFDSASMNHLPQTLTMPPGGCFLETVTIDRDTMLHLKLTHDLSISFNDRDAQLTLFDAMTGEILSQSDHGDVSGNAISCPVKPGTYCVAVTTDDADAVGMQALGSALRLEVGSEEPSMKTIGGLVSVDCDPNVFPVSLRSITFADGKRVDDPARMQVIDPTKPVWLVIHGRNDNPTSGKFDDLERALCADGFQVIACDWSGPASDNIPSLFGLQGENWIAAVGAEVRSLLQTWNIAGANVHIAAHSWGTFVGYEVAKRYKEEDGFGVQAFVALDPAADPPMTGYDATQVNFENVSNASWALHSSIFGSDGEALTAEKTFEIRSDAANPVDAHGLAVTTFANLIRAQEDDPANGIAQEFDIEQLSDVQTKPAQHDHIDGWLWVSARSAVNPDDLSDIYADSVLQKFTATNPDDAIPDHYLFPPATTDETAEISG